MNLNKKEINFFIEITLNFAMKVFSNKDINMF